jgi:transposase
MNEEDPVGLIAGSVWRFSPQKKGDSKGDYHKVFNGANFVQWWKEKLLPNLSTPSIIYMDNAKYHKTYPDSIPKFYKLNKQAIVEWFQAHGVAFEGNDTKKILLDKARKYIADNVQYECVQLAEEKGHRVVFTPPCYSDLQPIELVWALIKGNVGQQYSIDTTLSMVLEHLDKEFEKLASNGSQFIQKMIDKCAGKGMDLYKEAEQDTEADPDDDDAGSEATENSNDLTTDGEWDDDADRQDQSDNGEDDQSVVGV